MRLAAPVMSLLLLTAAFHAHAETGDRDGPALKLLLAKGLISQSDYDAAVSGKGLETPAALPAVKSKWESTLYGFAELDTISDSTQSFSDVAGNAVLARPDSYAGSHGRLTFGVRNSRLGLRIVAPEYQGIKVSAMAEMDFLGNQPPNASEAATFTNPAFRARHFMFKLENPYLDVLFGQYWDLFGWQSAFHPNSVQIQGLPGEVFARAPQLRLSHLFEGERVSLEVAAAAVRPPQRDAWVPDGQAGLRLLVNGWKGVRTVGSTGTGADPLALGLSGTVRRFLVPELSASPKSDVSTLGGGLSADLFLPVLPRSLDNRANALTLTGSFTRGQGIADLYTGLTGGVGFPALPNPTGAFPAPVYPAGIDNGLVTFGPDGRLVAVGWQSFIVGVQYYLPPAGKLRLAANYSQMRMTNPGEIGAAGKVVVGSNFADANMFWDATPTVRLGLEYAWFRQTFADEAQSKNNRVQLSGFYLF